MKKIKKYALLSIILTGTASVWAIETGGLITNNSSFKTNSEQDFKLDQVNRASLWLRAPISADGKSYFAGEALYEFEKDFDEDTTTHTLDSDLFKLVLYKKQGTNNFFLSAGRFFYSDLSNYVYGQNADGLLLDYSGIHLGVSAFGAYTGLLNSHTTSMISSDAFGDEDAFEKDTDVLYDLAEKYVVGALTLRLKNLAGHDISGQFLGTFRVENNPFNRMYATVSFNGPVVRGVYYNAGTTFGFYSYDGSSVKTSNLSNASLTYYTSGSIPASVGLSGVYASGEQGGLSPFIGFTKATATYSYEEPIYSGIIKAGLHASVKPIKPLLLSASGDVVFDAASGDDSDEIEYTGFQYQVGAHWQVLSDVMLGANLTQYFDKDNDDDKNRTSIQIKAVISF